MAKISPRGNIPNIQKHGVKNPNTTRLAAPKPALKNEPQFVFSVLAAYFIIGLIGVFHHEMWRDELQIWLVGSSAHSFGEFLRNMTNECNPFGWYFIDFILSRFTDSPLIVQIFHLLLATGTVYLILRYSPFNRLQKVLVSFSYYLFFEYSLIARGYALTIFFIFLFCTLYQQVKSKNRYLIISLVLFCLPNTTGHGVIMTLALLSMMVADYLFTGDASVRKKYKLPQLSIAVLVVLIGIYIAMRWITPPAGNQYGNNWYFDISQQRMALSFRTFWMSLIPIPNISTINFWNSNMFYTATTYWYIFDILFVLSLGIIFLCILNYSQKIGVLVFYVAATSGVLLFNYTNNVIFAIYAANHYGFIFITFIVAAWLAPISRKSTFAIPGLALFRDKLKVEKNFTYLVTALFAINMLGGVIAYSKDYSLIFSNIERTGKYIKEQHWDKMPEAGFIDYAVSPISAFTKQAIYYPDRDTTSRFTVSRQAKYTFDLKVIYPRLANFISRQKDSVLYISTGDYFEIGKGKMIDSIQFTPIALFYGSVVPDEFYILYIAKKIDINKLMRDSNSFRNPKTLSTMMDLTSTLLQAGKLDRAEKILLTVQEKTHGQLIPSLHNYLGQIYSKKNMPAEAEKEFRTEIALNLEKENAFFNLGMLYYRNKDYNNAIIFWDSTIHINPKNSDALNNLGVCYLNYKNDNNQAKLYFERALEIDPDYKEGYYSLLICAQNTNDEELLIKYIRILLSKGTSLKDIQAKGIKVSGELLQKINSN